MRTVVCVIGSVASGKSFYVLNNYDPEKFVIFAPGRIIRAAAGSSFMKVTKHPNAPAELDHFVISMFGDLLKLAESLDRTLVCDGFPRTSAQALVMLDILDMQTMGRNKGNDAGIEIVGYDLQVKLMQPSTETVRDRLATRGDDFDTIRLSASIQDLANVMNVLVKPPPFVRVQITEER